MTSTTIPHMREAAAADAPRTALRDSVVERLLVFGGFRLMLDAVYLIAIAPVFSHEGFVGGAPVDRLALSYLLSVIAASVTPLAARKPSEVLLPILLLTPVLPMQLLMGHRGDDVIYTVAATAAYLVIASIRRIRWPDIPHSPLDARHALTIAAVGVAATIGIVIIRGGLAFATLDAQAVYILRETAIEQASSGFTGYLVDWSMKVFIPAIAAVAALRRSFRLAFAALLLELPISALTAQKVPIGFIALVGVVMISARTRRPAVTISAIFGGVIMGSALFWMITGDPIVLSLITRRIFFVPANMNFAYHRFFTDAGFVEFSTVLPAWIGPYPFAFPPAQLVGDFLSPGTGMWANTGFLGTSYMHAGVAGLALYALAVGALAGFGDSLGRGQPLVPVSVVLAAPFATLFTSADLPTALLSHGVTLCLIFAWMLRRQPCPI
jgi:hypothetical protein